MNWGRYIARTAVRRVVWIVIGLVVYGVINLAKADGPWLGNGNCSSIAGTVPGYNGAYFNSIGEAQALACAHALSVGHSDCTFDALNFVSQGANGVNYHLRLHIPHPNNPNIYSNCPVNWRQDGTECPAGTIEGTDGNGFPACVDAQECPFVAGEQFLRSGDGTPPATQCNDTNNCAMQLAHHITFDGGYAAAYEITGNCTSEPDATDVDGANCISNSNGTTVCLDQSAENCGTVNGEYVCLANVPPGNCILTPGGQAICEAGSQTDPPDDTITDSNGSDFDLYADGDTGGTQGGTGNTYGSDDTGGSGGASGGGGDGDGDDVTPGSLPDENEAVGTFGETTQSFWDRIAAAPIIVAITSLPGNLPAGSCAAVESDAIAALDGTVLSIDAHCTLWDEIDDIIYAIMLAAWALLGGIIILRA